jgi:MarR family transcriptional regulator, organic hydroperoxide resistance regulator
MNKFTVNDLIGGILNKINSLTTDVVNKKLRSSSIDITPEQLSILIAITFSTGMTQTEIAERTYKDKTNITRILDILEKKALILRKERIRDRRVYEIHLTSKGKSFVEKILPLIKNISSEMIHGISRNDYAVFIKVINKIHKNLKEII